LTAEELGGSVNLYRVWENNWSPEECVEVHTRRKVERIKRNGGPKKAQSRKDKTKGRTKKNWYI
jgi:hypothetical protein